MFDWHRSPNLVEHQADPDMGAVVRRTMVGPNHELLATAASYCVSSTGGMIQFILESNGVGLFWEWTPAGIRRMAEDLRAVADRVEKRHIREANELLADTLKRPPPDQPAT